MPKSIPSGLTHEHVLRTLADLDNGIEHPFGRPTGYELFHEGKRYPPKAVVGLAFRYAIGRMLMPDEFAGGEAPGQANFVLRKLDFTVQPLSEAEDDEKATQKDWTQNEVRAVVTDYFAMLESEVLGKTYKKSEHRKALLPKLLSRTEPSIEFKHQNVSAVLVELGLPYIEGYKPRSNYQQLLATEVESFLKRNSGFLEGLATAPALNPASPAIITKTGVDKFYEDPPTKSTASKVTGKPWLSRKVRQIDFAERDAANRHLGKLGEQFVFELEQCRLKALGRDDLAQKVIWASNDIGDGLGFDILSFDDTDDSERLLEVKTTALGKFFPFYVTGNEVRCSEDLPQQFQLFRVFDYGKDPRLYILHGSLRELCQLDPVLYRAVV